VGVALGRAHTLDQGIDGQAAGYFAGGGSAHAIADYEGTGVETVSVRVFIGGAHRAGVAKRGGL
jgi:hypothetical protein